MFAEQLSTIKLHTLHQRLNHTLADLGAQLDDVEARRSNAFQRGVDTGDPRLRRRLARQVLLLDRHARLLRQQRTLAERQMSLLQHLVYAKETADIARQLEDSATHGGVDWLDALTWAATLRHGLDRRLQAIDDLFTWIEGLFSPRPDLSPGLGSEWARVARVPDGDGAVLEDGRRVRYLGIDAPEINLHGRTERYAREAKALNQGLVVGKRVRLERDRSDTDRYGRLLRYVWAGNTFVNAELLLRGAAFAMPFPPDTRHQALFEQLQSRARLHGEGLWAS